MWLAGNGDKDTNILKFTKSGKFLLQIGKHGKTGGSNDTANVNKAAGIAVHAPTNEVFVADGYGNRRVIVFDADTGAYKRHWGAYGNKPDEQRRSPASTKGRGPPTIQHGPRHRRVERRHRLRGRPGQQPHSVLPASTERS